MREGTDWRLKSREEVGGKDVERSNESSSFHIETTLPEGRIITRHFFANCRCVRERAEQFSRGGGRLKTGVEIDVTAELCQSMELGALLNGNF